MIGRVDASRALDLIRLTSVPQLVGRALAEAVGEQRQVRSRGDLHSWLHCLQESIHAEMVNHRCPHTPGPHKSQSWTYPVVRREACSTVDGHVDNPIFPSFVLSLACTIEVRGGKHETQQDMCGFKDE